MLPAIYRKAVVAIVRPYIRREWPGWGILYRNLVGSFEKDRLWKGEPERWVRGKLHGYEMSVRIEGWSNRATFFLERFYDLPTQLLLMQSLRPGDTFVDIGANEGMMTLLGARLVGDTGLVISFEPNPGPGGLLRRNLQRNAIMNVEFHAAGLGEKRGEMPLFVPHINTGEGSFTAPADEAGGEYVTCPVEVGDDMIGERTPRLIKIDVEGFEAHVLKGLEGTLARAKPSVCMEMIAGHLARDGQTPEGLCAWLAGLGYRARRLGLANRCELALSALTDQWCDGDYVFEHLDNPL
jgi:FkbM family methyltransferase